MFFSEKVFTSDFSSLNEIFPTFSWTQVSIFQWLSYYEFLLPRKYTIVCFLMSSKSYCFSSNQITEVCLSETGSYRQPSQANMSSDSIIDLPFISILALHYVRCVASRWLLNTDACRIQKSGYSWTSASQRHLSFFANCRPPTRPRSLS